MSQKRTNDCAKDCPLCTQGAWQILAAVLAFTKLLTVVNTIKLLICVLLLSFQAHMCFKKAAMVCGLQHTRLLKASAEHDYALDPKTLQEAIAADLAQGLIPFYACATIGTTSSCAVDPVGELGRVCQQ